MTRRLDNIAQCFDVVDELTQEHELVTSEMVPAVVSPDCDQGGPPHGPPPLLGFVRALISRWPQRSHCWAKSLAACLATNRATAQRFWTSRGLVELGRNRRPRHRGTQASMGLVRPRIARAIALSSVGLLAAGCMAAVDGSARPAANLKPRAITGQTIKNVLLGDDALSKILNQPFAVDPRFPSRSGGPETLQDSGSDLRVDCLGVAMMLQKSDYQSANVKHVAMEAWRRTAKSMQVTSVKEGVVGLASADDADALFAKLSLQWQKCDGATLFLPDGMFKLKGKITNVKVASPVLAATNSVGWAFSGSDAESIPEGRAIGVRANCLVEVEVDFFNATDPSPQGPGTFNTRAVDIAHAMMDKVSALI